MLAAAYALAGREDDAQWEAAEVVVLRPDFSASAEADEKPFVREEDRQHYLDALRRSGLPE